MMEEVLNRGSTPSKETSFPDSNDLNSTPTSNSDERISDGNVRLSLNARTPSTKKAKRVRFFRNGDKFYTGVVMAVTHERYRSFDSLASDLTRALVSSVTLPNGVRAIHTMDGRKIQNISELEDGKCYVVSGQGEIFKKVEYSSSKVKRGSSLSGLPQTAAVTGRQISAIPLCVKARIVTLIRHGTKPRKVVRLLLNKRNAPSLEHVMEAITEVVKLDSGAVRKVYTSSGQQVTSLEQFFENDDIFLAYGTEKSNQEDFELDFEESKCVQSFRRCPWISNRQNGPMPRMPRKSGKKVLTTPQVRTPSPSSLILPQPLRLHYAVGHVIGDGNFAVVRHCIHKATGAEYAMKIVDKYKCLGKETMLASEVAILRQVCHPNIISLVAEQETMDQLFLVMELVKGGDLFDAIAAATKFSEAEASVMIGHLTSALAYLHSHHIVHRDIKPENLLVEMEGSHVRCLKLGDFGLAQIVRENLYTVCGTPTYVAPEILAETGYGLKIDVWAAGVILYILLCGFPPFVSPENEQEELFERILSGQYEFTSPYWDTISNSAKQLITNMLQAQPELRFSAEDVLDHPWLAQSFLGGKQTSTTSTDSTEQYGDQQCKPIRLATFEFDYKKQRKHDDSQEKANNIDNSERSNQNNIPSSLDDNFIFYMNRYQLRALDSKDEIDLVGENYGENGPMSLSADCLQDIHALDQSVHNLINTLNKNEHLEDPLRLSHSTTSSMSSIPKNINLSLHKDNSTSLICDYHNSSSFRIDTPPNKSVPLARITKLNKRNGNSLSDINFKEDTQSIQIFQLSKKTESKRQNKKNTRFYKNSNLSSNTKLMYKSDDLKNCNTVSSSTDSFTGSSSNDIETSDSFVNIQFAQSAYNRKSSSIQSMESTDSFENIRISPNQDVKCNNANDPNQNNCKEAENVNDEVLKKKIILRNNTSKLPKARNFHADDKINSVNNMTKGQDAVRHLKNGLSYYSDDNPSRIKTCTKSSVKMKRFSYIPQYSTKKSVECIDISNSSNYTSRKDGRKFRSTDELRNEKQKQVKPKRFSLYYTPQPSRKTYETEPKEIKNMYKNSNMDNNERHNNVKLVDGNKKKDDTTKYDEQKNLRNRKSVIDASTVASRSKINE
ncbi:PREDICTED: serine/threonine-protein kinase GL21140 isoform X1 [Polistes canadensis]|uniref:serine/threonine-protein kinase GL21140 isoform X1 n=1 Tax=Polistes canadensis TaxID=91411 RepID=UPI000718D53C|nr:PREDICTED: serine/threonine-protein kinase GL21140 isoform X1 [Polistes canadensis]XP_014603694.1 PREDICTED: serine/threonine-protein kinase GL21140 isoform X1 [Polistes canadensis]XP_014603695.1 PREDICTED: serine/threonine-protein kinase GL21140 isoform X1 [Polistes canadensis]